MPQVVGLLPYFVGASVLLLMIAVRVVMKVYDRWALMAAQKYCEAAGLEYIEAKAFPNHYGLYFRKDGKRLYASYDFERNRTITWKNGSPLEVAERKLRT